MRKKRQNCPDDTPLDDMEESVSETKYDKNIKNYEEKEAE